MKVGQLESYACRDVVRAMCGDPERPVEECLEMLAVAGRCEALLWLTALLIPVQLPDPALVEECGVEKLGACTVVWFRVGREKIRYTIRFTEEEAILVYPGFEAGECSGDTSASTELELVDSDESIPRDAGV